LKLIIASLIIFSLVIFFLFALFPSDISVTRMVQIRSTRERVSKKIADLREWRTWNDMLPNGSSIIARQSDRTDSDNISRGGIYIELLKSGRDTLITRWRNGKKTFTGNYVLSEINGQVILEWSLHFHLRWYPWEKLASMFYDKQLGPLMENSLLKLKKELETTNG
jgi:hypothetical protein